VLQRLKVRQILLQPRTAGAEKVRPRLQKKPVVPPAKPSSILFIHGLFTCEALSGFLMCSQSDREPYEKSLILLTVVFTALPVLCST